MDKKHGHFNLLTSFFLKLVMFIPKPFVYVIYCVFQNLGGYVGLGIRYVCFYRLSKRCGNNVAIFPHVTLKHIGNISIGDNVSIHTMCYLDASGDIEIGNNVSIAHSSSIISFDHTYNDKSLPIKYNPVTKSKITICDDVWIGCGSRILKGITINSRCIIAAGAVVNNDTLRNTIYGGVPARLIKKI